MGPWDQTGLLLPGSGTASKPESPFLQINEDCLEKPLLNWINHYQKAVQVISWSSPWTEVRLLATLLYWLSLLWWSLRLTDTPHHSMYPVLTSTTEFTVIYVCSALFSIFYSSLLSILLPFWFCASPRTLNREERLHSSFSTTMTTLSWNKCWRSNPQPYTFQPHLSLFNTAILFILGSPP